jgi:hypothetical protein
MGKTTKRALGLLVGVALGAACGRSPDRGSVVIEPLPVAFVDSTLAFPHVRYADGQVSINDRCIVRKLKLSRMMRPVYVNGLPIGFC